MKKARLVGCLLAFSLFISILAPAANAVSIDQNINDIQSFNSFLSEVYAQINFLTSSQELAAENSYYIGTEIPVYEYIDGVLTPVSYELYPIFSGNEVIYFATRTHTNEGSRVQVSQAFTLAEEVNACIDNAIPFAIIYDSNKSYVVSANSVSVVSEYETIAARGAFMTPTEVLSLAQTQPSICAQINPATTLVTAYEPATAPASLTSDPISMTVTYKSQALEGVATSYLCWAASIACIGEAVTGISRTALEIAQIRYYLDTGNFPSSIAAVNLTATFSEAMSVMNSTYGFSYTYYAASITTRDSLIYNSIDAGNPVFSCWRWADSNSAIHNHACVVRGIDIGSYVLVMDPGFGFAVASAGQEIVGGYASYTYSAPNSSTVLSMYAIGV